MTLSPRDVATRMRAIEDNVSGETGEDDPPLDRVIATLLDVDYDGLDRLLLEEANRVIALYNDWYAAKHGVQPTPTNIAALGFLQGVTFAVAAQRLKADA